MRGKQLAFSHYELTTAIKQTKRETLLSEMELRWSWNGGVGALGGADRLDRTPLPQDQ
jgi:hypothetical protein